MLASEILTEAKKKSGGGTRTDDHWLKSSRSDA